MLIKVLAHLLTLAALSSTSFAGAPAADNAETDHQDLYEIVSSYGVNTNPPGRLGVSRFQLVVTECRKVVYPGAQATCSIHEGGLNDEENEILFDAIIEKLGVDDSVGLGVSVTPYAIIDCSKVVSPFAKANCKIRPAPLLGGGNISIGGKTTNTPENDEL